MTVKNKSFREYIERINNAIKPYYLFLLMIVFIIGLLFTTYSILIRPSGLTVSIDKEEINYPSKINNEIIKTYKYIENSNENLEIKSSIIKLYNYLINTQDYWKITISNNSSKSIDNINIRILNVSDLTSWGISSDYLIDDEKQKIMESLSYIESSGIINLRNSINLPPETTLCIYLWGVFEEFSFKTNVFVVHDGGTGKIIKTEEVSGIRAFIANSAIEILILLILIFLVVYRFSIKQHK